jgi:DNA-binding CsgD family transcriptional regulator
MRSLGDEGAWRLGREDAPTARQREVLALVARGNSSRQIAQRLGISRSTVETHILAARAKLSARTRAQAAALVVCTPADHECPLTGEERRLLDLLADGRALGEAAETLHLSRRTADRRLAAARGKLRVRTTAEAVLVAPALAREEHA